MSEAYRVREASLADADALVRHRIAMFTDMGVTIDASALDGAFRAWLAETMTAGAYRAWLIETERGAIVAGGGMTVLPWPPGPHNVSRKLAFVYNVYVEPAHRRRGLARRIMDAIHEYCSRNGIASMALNASRDGRPLYEALGYIVAPSPMMVYSVTADAGER
jgi:GNAT superfamily N-acetyltransferase